MTTKGTFSLMVFIMFCSLDPFQVKTFAAPYNNEHEPASAMLWRRGVIPDDAEDDPDVYRDTARLLDAIIMDGAQVVPDTVPPIVVYRFGSGERAECTDGTKTLKPQCQWSGMVVMKKHEEPQLLKLSVASKYCNRKGLTRPASKVIPC